jgi:PAS domain S-box-containing protein
MNTGSFSLMLTAYKPHGVCMGWQPGVLWLHVLSDLFIFLAYASISLLLLTVVRKRKDIPFHGILIAFAGFILACGITHLMDIIVIWDPLYPLQGIFKLCTAAASVATAMGLYRLLPVLLSIPSRKELEEAHTALARSHAELAESNRALQARMEGYRHSETQFRLLADSMPQIVWTAGPDGGVDYYNERWYNFSRTDRKLSGDASWMPLLHPEDVQNRRKAWYACVGSGIPLHGEYRFWDAASDTYRWYLDRAVPVKDPSGAVVKWFGAWLDIDEYKRAETDILLVNTELESRLLERTRELTHANEELRRAQTWLRAILRSATDVAIIALDNNGIIAFFNSGSERLLGYRAEELVGHCSPYILYPQEQCEQRARQLAAELGRPVSVDEIFLAKNQPASSFVSESVFFHRNGALIDVSLAISPMIDDSGERLGELAIAVDVRPRKALEQQLAQNNEELQEQTRRAEEANRAKTEFLSAISHEIGTPMNAILGMAELLWESELNELQRRYVGVFRRACTNLLALVNDILDLSKIESGRFELEQVDFDLDSVIQMSLEMIRSKTEAKHLVLSAQIAPGTPPALVGDPLRLQQILTNLLGHAVKFSEAGSISLRVGASAEAPSRLLFEVSDTGIGIPYDKQESIFQDFMQAESSTTRRFGGTGLGLGICRSLVHRMDGELRVRSTPGEGRTFSFDALFGVGSQEVRPRSELLHGLDGRRVLIVDDNQTNRLIFVEMCRVWGMLTSECYNAGDVLMDLDAAAKDQQPFELVIMDRLINEADTLQLVAAIRKSYPTLPILMTASDQIPGEQTQILTLGISGYAVKPIRRPELLRLLCELLGSAAQQPETAAKQAQPNKTLRVLIAEDSQDNQLLLQEYLESSPFEIQFVENGQAAVDLAGSQTFDLILMDMLMPVMDGLTATRLIRQAELAHFKPAVPIFALSANARHEDMDLSRAAGCDAHISKPISKKELILAMNKYSETFVAPAAASVTVDIPPGLEEAAVRYIQKRKCELPQFTSLVEAGEFEQVRRLAHNIKGTGASYGFPDLTRVGREIESAAREQNPAAVSAGLLQLADFVHAAESILEQTHPVARATP